MPPETTGSAGQDRVTDTAAHRTDETDLCPHCSKPLTAHRNHDCWPRCGKPNPDNPAELCSLPERHAELLNCPMCAYDAWPTGIGVQMSDPTATAATEPAWKASISGDAVKGYRVTVLENLCGNFYVSRDFPPRRTSSLWGARRVAARMLRHAQKSDDTAIEEEIT